MLEPMFSGTICCQVARSLGEFFHSQYGKNGGKEKERKGELGERLVLAGNEVTAGNKIKRVKRTIVKYFASNKEVNFKKSYYLIKLFTRHAITQGSP